MGKQQKVTILSGQTLWESLNAQGITIPRCCGGKGICQSCQVEIKGVGRVKSCEFTQEGTYEVILPMEEEFSVVGQEVSVTQEDFPAKALLIAIDLGTTTVAIKAITTEGEKNETFINPQRIYGADVMTRIDASTHGLQEKMKEVIKSKLNNAIEMLIKEEKFGGEKQVAVVVSGNTTMLHLLRGLSCEGLGKAPFVPVELGMKQENWVVAGKDCKVTYLPGISAFVGGDIVSGLYGLNLWHRKENSFFLDLGTNGEMALIKEGRIWVASAAAGPAFEGTPLALKLRAAGIINLLHFMWEENIIDEYGTLVDEYFEEGYPVELYISQLSANERKHFGDEEGLESLRELKVTQEEIRQIQMAKGAIRAGIDILLQEGGVSPQELNRFYLAGGMGFYVDGEKAIEIGLLPDGVQGKIEVAGNTSLQGALLYGREIVLKTPEEQKEKRQELEEIVRHSKEIVLANHKGFEEKYIENMNFWREI